MTDKQQQQGIPCPRCGSPESDVKDSRPAEGAIRRRRRCRKCGYRVTTYEILIPRARELADVLALVEDRSHLENAAIIRQIENLLNWRDIG